VTSLRKRRLAHCLASRRLNATSSNILGSASPYAHYSSPVLSVPVLPVATQQITRATHPPNRRLHIHTHGASALRMTAALRSPHGCDGADTRDTSRARFPAR
jgi:hypothetical protein